MPANARTSRKIGMKRNVSTPAKLESLVHDQEKITKQSDGSNDKTGADSIFSETSKEEQHGE